ncbi:hypothetical protein CYMTET_12707 [Cymbomonas tetramitiformis]|uniref:Uncharacterized protein n=1 Tax=Cymbomonas tetramitiformis TaxID=36881 RepID=A0AAE0LC67_9CHLO|nr:hypothetical protein CYMTET_12707 [Cymbomonas tetramitiformis]
MRSCYSLCKYSHHCPEVILERQGLQGLDGKGQWPVPQCQEREHLSNRKAFAHSSEVANARTVAGYILNYSEYKELQQLSQLSRHNPADPCGVIFGQQFGAGFVRPDAEGTELEMMVKVMINVKPETYLEIGTGKSTSWFPLISSQRAYALENSVPYCESVLKSPVVECLVSQGRLQYVCGSGVNPDGTPLKLAQNGYPAQGTNISALAHAYVFAIDTFGFSQLDMALVDGRFRVACALKLLNYFHDESVLLIHDFWTRPQYGDVFRYYDLIGYTYSLAVLRRKNPRYLLEDWRMAWKRYLHDPF